MEDFSGPKVCPPDIAGPPLRRFPADHRHSAKSGGIVGVQGFETGNLRHETWGRGKEAEESTRGKEKAPYFSEKT